MSRRRARTSDVTTWRGPRTEPAAGSPKKAMAPDLVAGRKWWAFQPLTQTAAPVVKQQDWARKKIDFFVLQELQAKQLSPSPPADPRTLLQRAYLDLIVRVERDWQKRMDVIERLGY